MAQYHLAQVNIGRLLAPLDDPSIAEFVANLAPINALADSAPGFVWRFQTPEGNAISVRPYEDDLVIINFSVWESIESLRDYVYKSAHADIMRKRRQWFEKLSDLHLALWWAPAGHIPTWEEAKARLEHMRLHGETPYAFTFRNSFPPEGALKPINALAERQKTGQNGSVLGALSEQERDMQGISYVTEAEIPPSRELRLTLPDDIPVGRVKILITPTVNQNAHKNTLGGLLHSEYFGIWRGRDDIVDGIRFARRLRRRAWSRANG
jgi:hypothetical protein